MSHYTIWYQIGNYSVNCVHNIGFSLVNLLFGSLHKLLRITII